MKPPIEELFAQIEACPERFFVRRQSENYSLFLELYETVGYAPSAPVERKLWAQRSVETCSSLDARLPGTVTGGLVEGRMVSSAGMLPLSQNALYGHSYCMVKTLEAAAKLYAQALHSLRWSDKYPSAQYGWVGSYNCRSRFTPLFQRPRGMKIQGQLEIEALRCSPLKRAASIRPAVLVQEVDSSQAFDLVNCHRDVFLIVCACHPALVGLHLLRILQLDDIETGDTIAIVIKQAAPAELTAFNISSQVWVFPTISSVSIAALCRKMRADDEFKGLVLTIVNSYRGAKNVAISGEKVDPIFWAFTPRSQIDTLRQSFRAAFATLFGDVSDNEAVSLKQRLLCVNQP